MRTNAKGRATAAEWYRERANSGVAGPLDLIRSSDLLDLFADLADAVEIIRELEWCRADGAVPNMICPVCGGGGYDSTFAGPLKHRDGCKIAAFLREPQGEDSEDIIRADRDQWGEPQPEKETQT